MILEQGILFLIGIAVGAFGTIVGVGGGFIIVPLLLFVYHAPAQYAVGTSLSIICLNAISGTVTYARQKRIDYRTGIIFAVSTLPGAVLGASIIDYISGAAFDVGFGVFLLIMAAVMIFRSSVTQIEKSHEDIHIFNPDKRISYNVPLGMIVSFLVGFLSSLAGVGGGIVHVPAMIYLFGFPPFIAVSTSHFILAISTTVGAVSHAALNHILWEMLPALGAGVILGAQIGARLSKKVRTKFIIRGLALAVIFVAVRLITKHL
jgi:uncharacterized membrane protein YfcA